MLEAYDLTRKDGAPGIDGVTATDYEANLEANLLDLAYSRDGDQRFQTMVITHSR
jgi:hypothetical protein